MGFVSFYSFTTHALMLQKLDSTTTTTTTNILHINVTQADIALAPAYRLSYTTRADDNTFAIEEVYLCGSWSFGFWA